METEDGREDHLEVHPEGGVMEIVSVDPNLVRKNHFVVVALRVIDRREEFFFVPVFERGGAGDAGAEPQDLPVVAGQGIGKTGHIGTRTHETHLAHQDVPQFGQFVQLVAAEPGPQRGDAGVAGHGDRLAGLVARHRPELHQAEGLPVLADAHLAEEHRSVRHPEADKQGHHQEHRGQRYEPREGEKPVEEEFGRHNPFCLHSTAR